MENLLERKADLRGASLGAGFGELFIGLVILIVFSFRYFLPTIVSMSKELTGLDATTMSAMILFVFIVILMLVAAAGSEIL